MYSTDDVAKAGRTTLRGVRFWDMNNLFGEVKRDENGARIFTDEHMKRAAIIGAATMAGMSLAEIRSASDLALRQKICDAADFLRDTRQNCFGVYDL